MSNTTTPLFELQRTAIEQNRKAFHETVEAQKTAFNSLVDGIEANRELTERNADLSRSALLAYVDAVETVLPEDATDFAEVREAVDDGYETWTDSQADAWDQLVAAVTDSGDAYEEIADAYVQTVDSSFDAFLEHHERLEANLDETATSIDVEAE